MKRRARNCAGNVAGVFAGFFLFAGVAASDEKNVSIAARAGTLGAGLELKLPLGEKLNFRLAGNEFNETVTDKTLKENQYDGEIDLATYGLIADWHPGGGAFRISFGAYANDNKITAKTKGDSFTYNGRKYTGEANLLVEFDSTAPYFGIGWSSQESSGLSFDVELGALYQDIPLLTVNGNAGACGFSVDNQGVATVTGSSCSGIKTDLETDLEAEHKKFRDDHSDSKIYPVISLGIQLRF